MIKKRYGRWSIFCYKMESEEVMHMALKNLKILAICSLVMPLFGHTVPLGSAGVSRAIDFYAYGGPGQLGGSPSAAEPCHRSSGPDETDPKKLRMSVALLPPGTDHSFGPASPEENLEFLASGSFGASGAGGSGTLISVPGAPSNRRFVISAGHSSTDEDGNPINRDSEGKLIAERYQFCSDLCGKCYKAKRIELGASDYRRNPSGGYHNQTQDIAFIELEEDVCSDSRIKPAQVVSLTQEQLKTMMKFKAPVRMAAFYYPSIISDVRKRLEAANYNLNSSKVENLRGSDKQLPGEVSARYISSGRILGVNRGMLHYNLESYLGGSGSGVVFTTNGQNYLFAVHSRAGTDQDNIGVIITPQMVARLQQFVVGK